MARYVRRSAKASPMAKATTSYNRIFITKSLSRKREYSRFKSF